MYLVRWCVNSFSSLASAFARFIHSLFDHFWCIYSDCPERINVMDTASFPVVFGNLCLILRSLSIIYAYVYNLGYSTNLRPFHDQGRSDGGYIGLYTPKSVYLKFFMWLFCLLDPFIPTQIKFLTTPLLTAPFTEWSWNIILYLYGQTERQWDISDHCVIFFKLNKSRL